MPPDWNALETALWEASGPLWMDRPRLGKWSTPKFWAIHRNALG
jgi:hypothetical protein